MKRVLVHWEDSITPTSSWQWRSEAKFSIARIKTMGWLVEEAEQHLAVAGSVSVPDEDGDVQINGVIVIPRRCIIRIEPIQDGGVDTSERSSPT